MQAIMAKRVLSPYDSIEPGVILIDGARIAAVGRADRVELPPETEVIDARRLTVAPGLIDLHTHGGGGAQAIDGSADNVVRMAAFYAEHGVTGFLVGVWGSNEHIRAGIDATLAAVESDSAKGGAAVLGIYLEGPFINPAWCGAFQPDTIVPPNPGLLTRYLDQAAGQIRLLTLAPEMEGAPELIRIATARGAVCAAGHSGARWEQMMQAADLGLRHITHTFNAMAPLHHRDAGILGAALSDDRFTAEIIVDGVHVHPAAVRLLVRAKRVDRAVLITDSISPAGLPDGSYQLEEQPITVSGGAARLADGTLAGSLLTMDQGVANLVSFGAASLSEALAIGSLHPARVIGLAARKGQVAPGWDADLIALDDQLHVEWTMVSGQIVFRRPRAT